MLFHTIFWLTTKVEFLVRCVAKLSVCRRAMWRLFACKISAIQCKNIFKSAVKQMWGRKNVRFSTDKSPYLRNGER